jgi:hypothetical protein
VAYFVLPYSFFRIFHHWQDTRYPNRNPHYPPTYLLFLTSVAWVNKHISHSLMTMFKRVICRSKQQSGITAVFPGEAVCMQATKMAHRDSGKAHDGDVGSLQIPMIHRRQSEPQRRAGV